MNFLFRNTLTLPGLLRFSKPRIAGNLLSWGTVRQTSPTSKAFTVAAHPFPPAPMTNFCCICNKVLHMAIQA